MKQFAKWLLCATFMLAGTTASAAASATIDKMFVTPYYTQAYQPGRQYLDQFLLFANADRYRLSDGSEWKSGAGTFSLLYGGLSAVEVVGDNIFYHFYQPPDGVLFRNTDYSWGDHSSQGVLGTPSDLVVTAKLGSTKAVISGYTKILSNDETWYGPLFNHYSAPVGSSVYFEQTYTLLNATFDRNLFNTSFEYNASGFVDFLNQNVPEPGSLALLVVGLAAAAIGRRSRRG